MRRARRDITGRGAAPLGLSPACPLPEGVAGLWQGEDGHALALAPCPPSWGSARCIQAEGRGG